MGHPVHFSRRAIGIASLTAVNKHHSHDQYHPRPVSRAATAITRAATTSTRAAIAIAIAITASTVNVSQQTVVNFTEVL
jgi:hypothetical protein